MTDPQIDSGSTTIITIKQITEKSIFTRVEATNELTWVPLGLGYKLTANKTPLDPWIELFEDTTLEIGDIVGGMERLVKGTPTFSFPIDNDMVDTSELGKRGYLKEIGGLKLDGTMDRKKTDRMFFGATLGTAKYLTPFAEIADLTTGYHFKKGDIINYTKVANAGYYRAKFNEVWEEKDYLDGDFVYWLSDDKLYECIKDTTRQQDPSDAVFWTLKDGAAVNYCIWKQDTGAKVSNDYWDYLGADAPTNVPCEYEPAEMAPIFEVKIYTNNKDKSGNKQRISVPIGGNYGDELVILKRVKFSNYDAKKDSNKKTIESMTWTAEDIQVISDYIV